MGKLEEKMKHVVIDASEEIDNMLFEAGEDPKDICRMSNLIVDNNVTNIKTVYLGDQDTEYNPFA